MQRQAELFHCGRCRATKDAARHGVQVNREVKQVLIPEVLPMSPNEWARQNGRKTITIHEMRLWTDQNIVDLNRCETAKVVS